MPTFQIYNVIPTLPAALEPLREMSFNLWWTWEPLARRLFRHLDPDLWNRTNHNPVRMLQLSRQARLEELAQDKAFLRELKQVHDAFRNYLARQDTYGKMGAGAAIKRPVAYFSAEFGFHESIPNYSGGLGILAGDHCKSASDLDLNFVAVGLLYRHGYFRQEIDRDGAQRAVSLNQNFHHLPIREVQRDGANLLVSVRILDREVFAKVWQLPVGRINLFLLDTDTPENNAEDRLITAELYGGDQEMRMRQEIILGIGGVKALKAMDVDPEVFHMNEGHSAFLALERIRRKVVGKKLDFYSALQIVASANVFTTHTPVPAGNDSFARDMTRKYFVEFGHERVKARRERIGDSPEAIRNVNRILDPEILTIGFARRFATYKRGALLFSDKERLKRLLNDTTRPVQFIFAGKAHPRDEGGRALIQEVYKFSREAGFENRVVFLEDYDSYIARRLVQGVDLWL